MEVINNVHASISKAKLSDSKSIRYTSVPNEYVDVRSDTSVTYIQFDQMNVIAHQYYAATHDTPAWSDSHNAHPVDDAMIFSDMTRVI